MANGLRWWVIPGALVVLLATLLRIGADRTPPEVTGAGRTAAEAPVKLADQLPAGVAVRDASGSRAHLDLQAAQPGAFVLGFDPGEANRRVALTVWRRDPAAPGERALWSELRPMVRADGTVPMLGVPAGNYDVEAVMASGARIVFDGIAAPGVHAAPQPAAPAR